MNKTKDISVSVTATKTEGFSVLFIFANNMGYLVKAPVLFVHFVAQTPMNSPSNSTNSGFNRANVCSHHDDELQNRTRHGNLLVLLTAFVQYRKSASKKKSGRPYALQRNKRPCFWEIVRHINGKQFRKTFRLTCYQFRTLVGRLSPMLDRNKVMADRASGLLQAEVKTALLLRILSGGKYHDLCLIFNIQSSSLYDVFRRTLTALLAIFKLPGIPEDVDELKKMALDFKLSRPRASPLKGYIGALDSIAIKIRKPHKRFHPAQFYCRKGFYAIPVQAMVDSTYRFRCFSALCVGSTHDSLSHDISALGKFLREGRLPPPFWIAADEAYVCTEFLLIPFSSSSFDRSCLSKYKDSFNYFQSSLRMHVEQAFGILVGRFGILWRPLCFSLETNTRIVLAAMLLQNFCIDRSKGQEPETMSEVERRQHATAFRIWYHGSRANISAQHEIVSAVTYGDRAMEKSLPRREIVNFLRETFTCVPAQLCDAQSVKFSALASYASSQIDASFASYG